MKRIKRLKRVCLGLLLILFMSLLVLGGHFFTARGVGEMISVEVEVRPGDSLWSIAQRYYPKERDVRPYIYEMKRVNQLDDVLLRPGQKITLILEE